MCRILAYWGKESRFIQNFLLAAPNSLYKQSIADASNRPNADGWGVAYMEDGEPKLIKRPQAAFMDKLFQETGRKIKSNLIFAHVRRGSQGHICYENTHPFVHQNWMFMHNGNIPDFQNFQQTFAQNFYLNTELLPEGSTDSEFVFKCVIQQIKLNNAQTADAVLKIFEQMILQVNELVPLRFHHLLALNFLISNGEFLLGYRQNRTLFYSTPDNGILIASEKIQPGLNWQEIPEKHFLILNSPAKFRLVALESGVWENQR